MTAVDTVASVQSRRWLPRLPGSAGLIVGGGTIAVLVLIAVLAPVIAPHDPNKTDLLSSLAAPSGAHPLGTDGSGRDILSRLIYGSRLSLIGPLIVVALSLLVGIPAGLVAGYRGGWVDSVISRVLDMVFGFPPLLLAIIIVATFGAGFWTATSAIAITYIPLLTRVVRGVVLVESRATYTDACRSQGFSALRITTRHILPNVAGTIVAQSTLNFGYALLDLAGLAFLGLGTQPPTADWGQMLSDGRGDILLSTNELTAASVVIAVAVIGFNLLGDSLARNLGRERR